MFVICTAKCLLPIVIKLLDQKNQNMMNVPSQPQQVPQQLQLPPQLLLQQQLQLPLQLQKQLRLQQQHMNFTQVRPN